MKAAAAGRKSDKESISKREAILDATEAMMVEEGYATVTSRRVAEKAGLKSKLVHYYFATMDELFVALYERAEKHFLQRLLQAANSPNPLRAIWELSIHPQRTLLSQELIALSNHRPSIRRITTRVLDQIHAINTTAITRYLRDLDVDLKEYSPAVISKMIVGLSRALVNEGSLGVEPGHDEIHAFAARWLRRFENRARTKRRAETVAR
jgi:AcrR family transcriptional regulator